MRKILSLNHNCTIHRKLNLRETLILSWSVRRLASWCLPCVRPIGPLLPAWIEKKLNSIFNSLSQHLNLCHMLKVILPCQFLDPQSPRYLRPPLHCLQTLCGCRGASIWQANSSITNIINHPNSPVKMQLYWSNLLTNSNLRQLCRHLLLNSSRSLGVTAELW